MEASLSCAAGVLYLDVICIFKPSCGMITDTSLASQAHANGQLPVRHHTYMY